MTAPVSPETLASVDGDLPERLTVAVTTRNRPAKQPQPRTDQIADLALSTHELRGSSAVCRSASRNAAMLADLGAYRA